MVLEVTDFRSMSAMSGLFIKGYKVDREKLAKCYAHREDDPENTRFLPIVALFPRESYKYIETGEEPDGHISFVVVLEDEFDKSSLEKMPMPDFDLRGAGEIMTEGVWPKF